MWYWVSDVDSGSSSDFADVFVRGVGVRAGAYGASDAAVGVRPFALLV